MNRMWSEKENAFLKESVKKKADIVDVASHLKRTPRAVYSHAYVMGLDPHAIWDAPSGGPRDAPGTLVRVPTKENSWVPIRKMNREQCERMAKLLTISNAEKFIREFEKAFSGATFSTNYTTYSHRKARAKEVQKRLAEIDAIDRAAKDRAAKATVAVAVPSKAMAKEKVLASPALKGSPDMETLLTMILNEDKAQTQLLAEIAGRLPKAS